MAVGDRRAINSASLTSTSIACLWFKIVIAPAGLATGRRWPYYRWFCVSSREYLFRSSLLEPYARSMGWRSKIWRVHVPAGRSGSGVRPRSCNWRRMRAVNYHVCPDV